MTCKYFANCLHASITDSICSDDKVDRLVECVYFHEYEAVITGSAFILSADTIKNLKDVAAQLSKVPMIDFGDQNKIKIAKKVRYICENRSCHAPCILHSKGYKNYCVPRSCPLDYRDVEWEKQIKIDGKWVKAT